MPEARIARQIAELYVRVSTATQTNSSRKEAEFDAIARLNRYRTIVSGVRCNIGLSGDISSSTSGDLTYWQDAVDRCVAAGLKLSIGLGGEGPNKTLAVWKALNGGTEWTYNRRPVPGTANAVWLAMVAIKQACIDYAYTAYTAAGLDFTTYVSVEIGNEPGLGGSGASGIPTDGTFGGITDQGYWDSSEDITATALIASYLEQLNYEIPRLNFRGAEVVAPSFEAQDATMFVTELATYSSADTGWIAYVDKWAINLYYSAPEYPGLPGAREYSRVWAHGQNNLGTDTNCSRYKADALATSAGVPISSIYITEVGVSSTKLGMDSGDPENHYARGEAIVRVLEEAASLGVGRVTLYTVSDTSSASADDRYGWLNDSLDTYSSFAAMLRASGQNTMASDAPPSGSWTYASGEPTF